MKDSEKLWRVRLLPKGGTSYYLYYACLESVINRIKDTDFREMKEVTVRKKVKYLTFEDVIASNNKAEILQKLKGL